ncbi:hypothetical protein [uncultured Aliiroseovarius sp.]|uniref:hypothetical protein n=1 Tax=uncultured Aliiroseovarius sp. TaxID=1658783 RepID=UPI0026027302|nr:hypothetical protein [uncultured Aliiroseovarius sp.]
MKSILRFIRVNIQILFVVSFMANIGLGLLSFVVQPAAVASAVAATKLQAEISERKAVAKAKAKSKARLQRVVAAIPLAGMAGVAAFEYSDYQAWLDENPEGSMDQYASEVATMSKEVAGEVLDELPAPVRPDSDKLLSWLDATMNAMRSIYQSEGH